VVQSKTPPDLWLPSALAPNCAKVLQAAFTMPPSVTRSSVSVRRRDGAERGESTVAEIFGRLADLAFDDVN
jgi:hypothetical protein